MHQSIINLSHRHKSEKYIGKLNIFKSSETAVSPIEIIKIPKTIIIYTAIAYITSEIERFIKLHWQKVYFRCLRNLQTQDISLPHQLHHQAVYC